MLLRRLLPLCLFFAFVEASRVTAQSCTFPLASKPATEIPEGFGVNINFSEPLPGELRLLTAAGFRWVRTDFRWELTEQRRGVYDFTHYERLLAAYAPYKLRVIFILDYGNRLYDDGAPRNEESRRAFARWAVAAAKHFSGRGIWWELYNEPNNQQFWPPKPDVNEYVLLAHEVGRAFQTAVPSEKLIGPAVGEMDFAFLEACFQAGLLEYFAAVSIHPYLRGQPENVAEEYCRLRKLIARYSPKREIPIISGEWGYSASWPGVGEEKQAWLLARQWLTNAANGIPISIWYDWRNGGHNLQDPEHNFGVVEHAYQPETQTFKMKPAYFAAKTVAKFFAAHRFVKRLPGTAPDTYVLAFQSQRGWRYAAWTTSPKEQVVQLSELKSSFSITSHLGQTVGRVTGNPMGLTLTLRDEPIYLRPKQ